MADKYSIILYSKDTSGKTLSKTISDINPEAQPSELKAMAQGLNSLTTNVYESADRVARENVDTATDKQTRTPTMIVRDNGNATNVPLDPDATEYNWPLSYIGQSNKVFSITVTMANDDSTKVTISNLTSTDNNCSIQWNQLSYSVSNIGASNIQILCQQITQPFFCSFTASMEANTKYTAWSKNFRINFTGGE